MRAHPELVTENSLADIARDYATTTQVRVTAVDWEDDGGFSW